MRLIADNTIATKLGDRRTSLEPEHVLGFSSIEIIRRTHNISILWRDSLLNVGYHVLNALADLGSSVGTFIFSKFVGTINYLVWRRNDDYTWCIHKGSIYQLGLLNGRLLINGAPSSRLPDEIVKNSLYERTFNQAIFTVFGTADGYESVEQYRNTKLRFKMIQNQLRIERICKEDNQERTYILIPHTCFSSILPHRLVEGYSHWLSDDRQISFLPPCFWEQAPGIPLFSMFTATN